MAQDVHTIAVIKGSVPPTRTDRLFLLHLPQQAYPAGSGAGANVTFQVTGPQLPPKYSVLTGDLGQAGDCFITNRTASGFTVNIAPPAASATLAAGFVDLEVIA